MITGGSQGLGRALAMQLAGLGANVCIMARDPAKLKLAVSDIKVHTDDG